MIIEYIRPHVNKPNQEIFKSEDEMKKSLTRFCYGDLYIVGRIWIQALRTALVGAKISLIPTVQAAKPPGPPERPPPMKYTDLPLYTSPHYEYKDYIADTGKCPKVKVKILHAYLAPHVTNCRKQIQKSYKETRSSIDAIGKDICKNISDTKRDFKSKMRCPDNMLIRQGVVALGGTVGFLAGGGRGIPRRLFFTGAGLLAAGALCFPAETDEAFRSLTFNTAKTITSIYNMTCGKMYLLRERVPCNDDMPLPTPPGRKSNTCPK